jgi:hypothetical protein
MTDDKLQAKWDAQLKAEGLGIVYPHPKYSAPPQWMIDNMTEPPKYSESADYDEWLRLLFIVPLLPYGYRVGLYLTGLTESNVNRLSKEVGLQQPTLFRQMTVAVERAQALADTAAAQSVALLPSREPMENTKALFNHLKATYPDRYEAVCSLLHYGSIDRAASSSNRNYKYTRRHIRLFIEESQFDTGVSLFREAVVMLRDKPVHLYASNRGLWDIKGVPGVWGMVWSDLESN